MSRYENRIIKLFRAMNNICYWWELYGDKVDRLLLDSYPFTISYDELVSEYSDVFHDVIHETNSYQIRESNISRVEVMIFGELREICKLIGDFYKYDKERFLREIPNHWCDIDLLESVIKWHDDNVVKNRSTQQNPINSQSK